MSERIVTILYIDHTKHKMKDRHMPDKIKQVIDGLPSNLRAGNVLTSLLDNFWEEMDGVTPQMVYDRYKRRKFSKLKEYEGKGEYEIVKAIE